MLVEIIQEHAKDWPANITGIDIRACGAGYGDESIAKRLSTQPVFVDFIVRDPEATITPDGTTWYEIALSSWREIYAELQKWQENIDCIYSNFAQA